VAEALADGPQDVELGPGELPFAARPRRGTETSEPRLGAVRVPLRPQALACLARPPRFPFRRGALPALAPAPAPERHQGVDELEPRACRLERCAALLVARGR